MKLQIILAISLLFSPFALSFGEILALTGATIYISPDDQPLLQGVILIEDGKIIKTGTIDNIKIPEGAATLDCSGMFITAGFQNSHVHFTEDKFSGAALQPAAELDKHLTQMFLQYGFTTVVDTGSMLENTMALRSKIEAGAVKGPHIISAGSPLYPENGIPFYLKDMPPEILASLSTPSTSEEAADVVRSRVKGGAEIIKIFSGSWAKRGEVLNMPQEIASAAVKEAHDAGKLVYSHASNVKGLEVALNAGVDVLAHALDDDRGWNETHIKRMKSGRMAMIPTLKLFKGPDYFKYILQQVTDYAAAGGQILFGTDVGFLTDYSPQEEFELMSQAGMDWKQILASLTTAPAEKFGHTSRRGRIVEGLDADLVVLGSNPAKSIDAFSNVRVTIRKGRILYKHP